MNNLTQYFITGVLVLAVLFLLDLNYSRFKFREKESSKIINKLTEQNDSLLSATKITSAKRDSLLTVIKHRDSLDKSMAELVAKLNRELKSIKGRYNNYTPSELEKEMEERYESQSR